MSQRTAWIWHPYNEDSVRQVVPWDKTLKEAQEATKRMIAKPAQGGVEAMAKINQRKADKLYGMIDDSGFYANPVEPIYRSWMNVPFTLGDASLDSEFLKLADSNGFLNLKGHRSVGGMRASIYNAVPESSVDALIGFMKDFEKSHG